MFRRETSYLLRKNEHEIKIEKLPEKTKMAEKKRFTKVKKMFFFVIKRVPFRNQVKISRALTRQMRRRFTLKILQATWLF